MLKIILSCLLLSGTLAISGQNQHDEQGRKSGHWKVDYPNGKTLYRADFIEGRPVGEMIRYYESGAVKARMEFDSTGIRSYAHMFYKTGQPAAEGWFIDKVKDSVWTYYSSFDGSVRIREPYINGKLHGMARSYYTSRQISDEVQWENNKKQGTWKQYYNTGAPRLSAHYHNDQLNGSYEVYYADGNIKIKGEYLNNRSHGTWSYFDDSGKMAISLEFLSGIPVDSEKYDQWIQDTLEKYQEVTAPESFQNLQ
jgi:antitoxin component YwqK of YwqJK toxin-antitoxin module